MPKIAEHNKTYKDADYTPTCGWANDCYVQWGRKGIVLSRSKDKPSYKTAFFEAFPNEHDVVSGFIRGEGATLGDAEKAAFLKYTKHKACSEHKWARKGYSNGLGTCRKCGAIKSGIFNPIAYTANQEKSDFRGELPWYHFSSRYENTFENPNWNEDSETINGTYYGAIRKGIPDKDSYLRKYYLRWKLWGQEIRAKELK